MGLGKIVLRFGDEILIGVNSLLMLVTQELLHAVWSDSASSQVVVGFQSTDLLR